MTTDTLPCHSNNLIRLRVRAEGRDRLLPEYLYYVLLHLFQGGAFKSFATGGCQQAITIRDVKDVLILANPAFRWLTEVRSGANDLEAGDILLQRVGTCGRPFRVTNINPLSVQASE